MPIIEIETPDGPMSMAEAADTYGVEYQFFRRHWHNGKSLQEIALAWVAKKRLRITVHVNETLIGDFRTKRGAIEAIQAINVPRTRRTG